jgi:hypothetical protein
MKSWRKFARAPIVVRQQRRRVFMPLFTASDPVVGMLRHGLEIVDSTRLSIFSKAYQAN